MTTVPGHRRGGNNVPSLQGDRGYADIIPGLPVILKDQKWSGDRVYRPWSRTGTSTSRTFSFSMQNVPDTATFYVIPVSSHRGDSAATCSIRAHPIATGPSLSVSPERPPNRRSRPGQTWG